MWAATPSTAVFFDAEDGGYDVVVPTLPGCMTQGYNFTHSLLMVEDAITCYLLAQRDIGGPIPVEGDGVLVRMGEARQAFLRKVAAKLGEPQAAGAEPGGPESVSHA